MRLVRAALTLVVALAAGLAAPGLYAEGEDTAWFRHDPHAAAYSSVQADLRGIFDQAAHADIPPGPLMDKLREGVSKGVSPQTLVAALRAELGRLAAGEQMLASRHILLPGDGQRESSLKAISLLLLAGVPAPTVEAMVASASAGRRDAADISQALQVLLQIKLSTRLTDKGLLGLGSSLLASRLPREAFASLPGLMRRADARGIDDDAAAAAVAGVLDAGGGVMQMEEELQKIARGEPARAEAAKGKTPAAAAHAPAPAAAQPGTAAKPAAGETETPGSGAGDHEKDR